MPAPGELRERITLQRAADNDVAATKWSAFTTSPKVWAAVEPLGDRRYRVRIRYRDDLKSIRDCEPAVRVLYDDLVLNVDDVTEAERRVEVHLICTDLVVPAPSLATGGNRRKALTV